MKLEMRRKLAREPFEEKIRKVGQLLHLAKRFPRRANDKLGTAEPMGVDSSAGARK
jgi:hypothetical protein